jgi:hypothetical protein
MAPLESCYWLQQAAAMMTYAAAVHVATLSLIVASMGTGTTWFTRLTVTFVGLNGAIHTTSFLLKEIYRKHSNDVRGPSASEFTATNDNHSKSTDDESSFRATHASASTKRERADSIPTDRVSELPGEELSTSEEADESKSPVLPKEVRSNTPSSSPEPTSTKPQSLQKRKTKPRSPTTRATFRPLNPDDTSALSRSKRFRQLEGKLAAGIWYEKEYNKVKKLGHIIREYDSVKDDILAAAELESSE